MKKMTYNDLVDTFVIYNENNGITEQFDPRGLKAVIVYKQENWEKQYPLEQRSYEVISSNKRWLPNMLGNSIYGYCLDETRDQGVRLDWYPDWKVDYCYLLEEE